MVSKSSVNTKLMNPARDMRADLTSASPKACYHQKSGQQTAEVTDKISEKVNLGIGQTKDAKNGFERVR
jgi:hypothetical protein